MNYAYLHDAKTRAWWNKVRPTLEDDRARRAWMRAKAADGASRLGLGARGVFYKVNLNLFESYLEICTNEAPTVGTARKCLGLRLGRPAASIPDSLIEACFFLREIRFNESPQKALEAFDLKKKDLWLLPTPRGPKIVEGPRRL